MKRRLAEQSTFHFDYLPFFFYFLLSEVRGDERWIDR